jgi:hypothetical protein
MGGAQSHSYIHINQIIKIMTKKEVLEQAIEQGNEYGFISWDGVLDICDEDMSLVRYVDKQLTKLVNENKVTFEYDN